jgi:hypothetical protein
MIIYSFLSFLTVSMPFFKEDVLEKATIINYKAVKRTKELERKMLTEKNTSLNEGNEENKGARAIFILSC